jgi:hypothetical protein
MMKIDNHPAETQFWVTAIETQDVVQRRHIDYPNIYFKTTKRSPQEIFEKLRSGKSKSWAAKNVTRILTEHCSGPHSSKKDADEVRKTKRKQLQTDKYTINMDTRTWRVYVIELISEKSPDGKMTPLYVGETSKSPEERFIEHRDKLRNNKGKLYSSKTGDSAKMLRYDLFPEEDFNRFYSNDESERAEKNWIDKLKNEGYFVVGGHKSH